MGKRKGRADVNCMLRVGACRVDLFIPGFFLPAFVVEEQTCSLAMKIGIVCYPTFGGSGVVATELGKALAKNGHQIHFITYQQPPGSIFSTRMSFTMK